MKFLIQALALSSLVLFTSCAHHGACYGDNQCKMKDKSCCNNQCDMKKAETKAETKEEPKK